MKKYLMTGIAALALCVGFTSCSHDLEQLSQEEIDELNAKKIVDNYNKAFVAVFGQPAANQDWGFTASGTRTRAITVPGTNDVYEKFPSSGDITPYFPTTIPEDAKTDAELEALYKGETVQTQYGPQQMWDLYAIYLNVVGKTEMNVKVTTSGEYSVGYTYANPANQVYNVYIAVGDGNNLTLKRNGAEHVNFYIMSGNITIDSNFGECGGIISVAEGATVNDQRKNIAHNDGVKIFNKGTYNATNTTTYWNGSVNTSTFDIGNFCTFYNEGTFTAPGGLSYSPGDANTSYFVNMGDDAVIEAASMTLNSSGNFYNTGTVTIEGLTEVTNDEIYWVNAGHYTTGSMKFSAKNETFFNYCQLIVEGNMHMYDGQFNLMDNSYTEAGSVTMDNFVVNMGSNTGMNILGDFTMPIGQQDATFQGFRTEGSNDFLRVGGTVTVAEHMLTFQLSGDITYAFGSLVDLGANNTGVQPTYRFNTGTTAAPLEELVVEPNETGCGSSWHGGDDPFEADLRIMAEDLSADDKTDFDFNDVVFDVQYTTATTPAKILVRAAGGTLPLRIRISGTAENRSDWVWQEVHGLWGKSTGIMINTNATTIIGGGKGYEANYDLDPITLGYDVEDAADANNIIIEVNKGGSWQPMNAAVGEPAAKFACSPDIDWADERVNLKDNSNFSSWVQGAIDTWNWNNF